MFWSNDLLTDNSCNAIDASIQIVDHVKFVTFLFSQSACSWYKMFRRHSIPAGLQVFTNGVAPSCCAQQPAKKVTKKDKLRHERTCPRQTTSAGRSGTTKNSVRPYAIHLSCVRLLGDAPLELFWEGASFDRSISAVRSSWSWMHTQDLSSGSRSILCKKQVTYHA